MNIDDITESKYLSKADVTPPLLLTISGVTVENLAPDDKPPENKWVLHFVEAVKPLVVNKTNAELIAHVTGARESDEWTGKQITLFNDPSISFGGKLTGGIRVQIPQQQASAPQTNVVDERNPPF